MNNNLRAYRCLLKLNQKDMAKKLNICLTSYNQKETGKLDFSQSEMLKITEIIKKNVPNITMDDIFFTNSVINLKTNLS